MSDASRRPSVVFLESNTTGTGRLFVRAARDAGYQAIMLARRPILYPFVAQDAVRVIELDTQSEREINSACRELGRDSKLSGITSTSDHYLVPAAQAAKDFDLPGPSVEAVACCRSKGRQYRTLFEAGVPVPLTRKADSVPDAVTAAEAISMPVVIKPEHGTGSVGVRLCHSLAELRAQASFLLSQHANERGHPQEPAVIIQEFIDGPEFSVEAIGANVIGITRKHLGPHPHFVEVGHDYPAVLSDEATAVMVNVTKLSLEALNLHWGAAHVELRYSPDGPKIIEVNPRLAGGFIPELIRLASGIDMIRELLCCVTGRKPLIQPTCARFCAIRFVVADRCGLLDEVSGIEEAKQSPTVVDAQIYRPLGSQICLKGDFRDRIGHVIGCGDKPNDVAQQIAKLALNIKATIR
jgi:S-sulfo-L-cysteine synthase (3-phospho-L-serine-dependent)